MTFMASYENYPSGHALKDLHRNGELFSSLGNLPFPYFACVNLSVLSAPNFGYLLSGNWCIS